MFSFHVLGSCLELIKKIKKLLYHYLIQKLSKHVIAHEVNCQNQAEGERIVGGGGRVREMGMSDPSKKHAG